MLMRVETSFRILGYPGFAMIFFLLAAIAGIALGITIVSTDVKARKKPSESGAHRASQSHTTE